MNWEDEHYVKLYTRDTLTWKAWPWQTRTLFLHLMRKLDGAGLIEVGSMNPVQALSMQLDLPAEVVKAGLPHLITSTTARVDTGALMVPNWIAAQEARKTEAQKKRDQRQRFRDQRTHSQITEIRESLVPRSPPVSPAVPLQPSPALPAQPSPAPQLLLTGGTPSADEDLVSRLQRLWNDEKPAECPRWEKTSTARRTAAKARLEQEPNLGVWRTAIQKLQSSAFVKGENDRGWVGDPTWLLRPDTISKILEGTYNRTGKKQASHKAPVEPQSDIGVGDATDDL